MSRNIAAPILALIVIAIINSIYGGQPEDQAVPWILTAGGRFALFLILTFLIWYIWNPVQKYIASRPKGSTAQRIKLGKDVRSAFTSRARQAGDNLVTAAGRLADRGLDKSAEDARRLREEILSIGTELDSLPVGLSPSSTGAKLGTGRAGEFVKFDKSLLALMEEVTDHTIELTGVVNDGEPDQIKARLGHLDETQRRLQQLIQERQEMGRGIR